MPGMSAAKLAVQVEVTGIDTSAKQLKDFGGQIDKLPGQFSAASKATGGAASAFVTSGDAARNAAAEATKLASGVRNAGDTMKIATDASGKMQISIKNAGSAIEDMGGQAEKQSKALDHLGTALQVGLAAGFAAVATGIAASVKTAATFEQSLANVGSVTGATTQQLAALRAEALQVGADTSKSASEAVDAFGELIKAGLSVESVIGGAGRTVVQLAEATGASVSDMAGLLSNALNTFGLAADQSAAVANTLARAANASAIDVGNLDRSLRQVGPVAAQAGLTMNDFATAIGLMGNHALKGEDAGTSLKTMLLSLMAPTSTGAAAMQALGLNMFDAAGKVRPFRDVLGDLQTKLAGATDAAKAHALSTIFGSDAIRAANILLGEGVKGWDNFQGAMAKAPTIAEMSKARLATLNGQLETLKGTLETAAITLGSKFLPALTNMASTVNAQLPGAFSTAGHAIELLQQHAGDLVPILGAIAAVTLAQIIPVLIAEAQAVYAATAAYVAKALAMAAANLPLAILGAAVAFVAKAVWDEAHAAENAAANTRDMAAAAAEAAAKSSPLIQAWKGLASSGASFSEQLAGLNQDHSNLDLILNREKESLVQLERQYADATAALVILNQSTTASNSEVQTAVDKVNALQIAQGNVKDAIFKTQAEIDAFTIAAKAMGFELTNAADGAVQYRLGAGQMASATKEQTQALQAANLALAELTDKQRKALAATSPLVKDIEEIASKANSMADAFMGAAKGIDAIAGRMTGAEGDIQKHIHSLDAAGSAAKAAFSAENRAAAAEWAQKARDAATAAGLTGEPLKRFQTDLNAVARYGSGAKGAMDDLTKTLDAQKAPLEDQAKAWADQRTLMADAAKAQLGMGQSLKDLAGEIQRFVDVFTARMGTLPGEASRISTEVVAAFQLSDRFAAMGAEAGQAYAAGLRLQAADAARAGRAVANASLQEMFVTLDAHSPSRKLIQLGEWAGEGLAIGLRSKVTDVEDAAGQMTDVIVRKTEDIDQHVRNLAASAGPAIASFLAQFGIGVPAVSALAASIASLSTNSMRPLLQQVANFDVAIAQLKVKLANTTAESEEAKAIQKQIDALERAKGAYTATMDAHNAYQRALELARTPGEVFTGRTGEINQTATNTTNYGATGASIVAGIAASLKDPAAAAGVADALNTLLTSDAFKNLPGSAALGTEIRDGIQRVLEDPSAVNIQWLLNLLGQAETMAQTRIQAMKPTFQSALADALSFDNLAAQVGPSLAGLFTTTAAAIDAGKELPIAALGRFRADEIAELAKLPQEIRDRLAPEAQAAWDEFIANPSAASLAAVQAAERDIHAATAIIPKGFADMLPEAQKYILQFVQMNDDGALSTEEAATRAGAAAMLFPKGLKDAFPEVQAEYRRLQDAVRDGSLTAVQAGERAAGAASLFPDSLRKALPEVRNLIRMIGAEYFSGALTLEQAKDKINDATNLIPANLHKLLPGIQADILRIVEAWRIAGGDIELVQDQIADAVKRNADATAAAAKEMEQSLSRLIAVQYQAGHQALQSGPYTSSLTGGPSGTNISSNIISNYAGIAGVIQSTITDAFGTFVNYSFPQSLQDAYGGNIAAIMYDLEHHLGVFMSQEEINQRLNTSAAAMHNAAAIAQGQASHINTGAATGMANAVDVNTANMGQFGGHVNDFGQIVNSMGQVIADALHPPATPSSLGDISDMAEMAARRRQWERDHPGQPAPFARGGITDGRLIMTGEKGPEIGVLPKGTHILSNTTSQGFIAAAAAALGIPGLEKGGFVGSARGASSYGTNGIDALMRGIWQRANDEGVEGGAQRKRLFLQWTKDIGISEAAALAFLRSSPFGDLMAASQGFVMSGGSGLTPSPASLQAMFGLPSSSQGGAASGGSGSGGSSSQMSGGDTYYITNNLTQQPGESAEQFAKRVVQVLRQQQQRQN